MFLTGSKIEFRNKLKEEIEQYWEGQSRNQLHDQLYHYMLDETTMEFPAEFLKRWLQIPRRIRRRAPISNRFLAVI